MVERYSNVKCIFDSGDTKSTTVVVMF